MVLGAAFPAVIGRFMIVPQCNHRRHLVQPLEVGVSPIGSVTQAIVGDRQNFRVGHQCAPHDALTGPYRRIAIFVDIVADMQPQVEIVARRSMGIGVEPAIGQVGTGKDAQAKALHVALRQRPGAADRRFAAIRRDEAIPVGRARLKPVNCHFRCPVAIAAGAHRAAADGPGEVGIDRDFDVEAHALDIARRNIAGP